MNMKRRKGRKIRQFRGKTLNGTFNLGKNGRKMKKWKKNEMGIFNLEKNGKK